jgi:hypothetical protein
MHGATYASRHLPSRALSHQSALQAYPEAIHSGHWYRPEWEEELLSLEKLYAYLAQCRWVRNIRPNGASESGSYYYSMGHRFARSSVAIHFDPANAALLCQPEGSEKTLQLPFQGLTKAELMGELAALQALPIYQLALPFSPSGLAAVGVHSYLDRHDFMRLNTFASDLSLTALSPPFGGLISQTTTCVI